MPLDVTLIAGTLPGNPYCWPGAQQFYEDIIALTIAQAPDITGISIGQNPPANTDLFWLRLDTSNQPIRWYKYQGQWLSPYWPPPLSKMVMIWTDTKANLWSYDEGTGAQPPPNDTLPTAVTATSGPFWDVDTNFTFRVPLGEGTSALGTNAIINTNGGNETIRLTDDQIDHYHNLAPPIECANLGGTPNVVTDVIYIDRASGTALNGTLGAAGVAGVNGTVDIMPPYRVVYFAKRTARQFYTVTP